jgi:hypothetical protein
MAQGWQRTGHLETRMDACCGCHTFNATSTCFAWAADEKQYIEARFGTGCMLRGSLVCVCKGLGQLKVAVNFDKALF